MIPKRPKLNSSKILSISNEIKYNTPLNRRLQNTITHSNNVLGVLHRNKQTPNVFQNPLLHFYLAMIYIGIRATLALTFWFVLYNNNRVWLVNGTRGGDSSTGGSNPYSIYRYIIADWTLTLVKAKPTGACHYRCDNFVLEKKGIIKFILSTVMFVNLLCTCHVMIKIYRTSALGFNWVHLHIGCLIRHKDDSN